MASLTRHYHAHASPGPESDSASLKPCPEPETGGVEPLSVEDILSSSGRPEATQWGRWKLRKGSWVLVYMGCYDNRWPTEYEIDLETIDSSAQMLDWIFQLVGAKTWMTVQDGADLIEAFRAIYRPQQNLCSWGRSLTIDPRWFLRERFRERRGRHESESNRGNKVCSSLSLLM
jgi:hypothetical protein